MAATQIIHLLGRGVDLGPGRRLAIAGVIQSMMTASTPELEKTSAASRCALVGDGRMGRARATRDRWVTEQRDSATLDPVD